MKVFNDLFSDVDSIAQEFQIDRSELDGVEILYAWYDYIDYGGDAFVLFRKDGKLYEANGSHCSCNGLEGCWNPTFTTVKALLMRPNLDPQLRELIESLSETE